MTTRVGVLVGKARHYNALYTAQMARKLRLSQPTMQRIEEGKKHLGQDRIPEVAGKLGIEEWRLWKASGLDRGWVRVRLGRSSTALRSGRREAPELGGREISKRAELVGKLAARIGELSEETMDELIEILDRPKVLEVGDEVQTEV